MKSRGYAGEAGAIAHLADGNFNEALKLAGRQEGDNSRLFLDWLRKCYRGNGVEMVAWVEKFSGIGRENQKHFLRYGLHFLREYMVLKLTDNANVRLRSKELTTAQNLLPIIELEQVEQMMNLFNDCTFYVERNANPKVLFLDTSIQVNRILKKKVALSIR